VNSHDTLNLTPGIFAHRLNLVPHLSLLLRKARLQGLHDPADFEALAYQRGCHYYPLREPRSLPDELKFPNEELAIALMHPSLPWDVQRLRIAAAMVSAPGNDISRLARLAIQEQALTPLRFIAQAGASVEPENYFWTELLAKLPPSPVPPFGVMPHPSRFYAAIGKQRPDRPPGPDKIWIRPVLHSK
jgi:hypothetical protein